MTKNEKRPTYFKQEKEISNATTKDQCEMHRKNTIFLLSEMKNLSTKLSEIQKSIININNELKNMYSTGNSLIKNDITNFIETFSPFSFTDFNEFNKSIETSEN